MIQQHQQQQQQQQQQQKASDIMATSDAHTHTGIATSNVTGAKRKSRFDSAPVTSTPVPDQQQQHLPAAAVDGFTSSIVHTATSDSTEKLNIDLIAAAFRASEFSKEISNKIAKVSSLLSSTNALNASLKASSSSNAAMPASLPAFNPFLSGMATPSITSRASYRPLLLDPQGREIDEFGNLVKINVAQIKTLAANVAEAKGMQKKENPYLAHRAASSSVVPSNSSGTATPALAMKTAVPVNASATEEADSGIFDDRLSLSRRDVRGRKALHFVEPGKLVEEAEKLKLKEERKIIAGYASGRKSLQKPNEGDVIPVTEEEGEGIESKAIGDSSSATINAAPSTAPITLLSAVMVPPYPDPVLPVLEWWDEAFLPKERRDLRKISKAASSEIDDVQLLAAQNARTYKLVQHPVPVKPIGGDKGAALALPMYMTKEERKKLRRSTRKQRELEKRDKMMMGLIPAPEPKFKLSNFMKVLGDQAVADPSKVEMKVLQQMQQRVLNHEMRNQAAKLTPQQRKEKRLRKLQEDTSRAVHVAVFRVKDFSNLKYRFKVDVNAQQRFLSGVELEGLNLVVVEGGPKGIRRFIRLMLERIKWSDSSAGGSSYRNDKLSSKGDGSTAAGDYEDNNEDDDDDDDDDSDDSDEETDTPHTTSSARNQSQSFTGSSSSSSSMSSNRCDLLWQGILPKRTFTGFKFQESKTVLGARKLLKSKGVGHYWDMVENADNIIAASIAPSLF